MTHPAEASHNGQALIEHGHERSPDHDGPSRKRSWFRALVQDFEPIWFTWCMNSGIIGILMHQYNYQFTGLPVLTTIAYLIDFTLFIVFSLIMITRLLWFRKQAIMEIMHNRTTLPLLACWPIGFMTVTSFVALTVSQASWGGHAFGLVAYVMWWFGAMWTVATLFFVMITVITIHEINNVDMPPNVIVPAVGVATVATIGGLLSSFAVGLSDHLVVPVIIFGFWSLGLGLLLALLLYTFILHRIFATGWPTPDETPSMFLLAGPVGQCAAALQLLGSAAHKHGRFAGYNEGFFITADASGPLQVACILVSMPLASLAVFWFIIAFTGMIYRLSRRELKWSPSWNAIIFPTGTMTASMSQYGVDMNSPFFGVITGILLVFLIIVFFVNLSFTVWEVSHGRLLIVREDPRVTTAEGERKQD